MPVHHASDAYTYSISKQAAKHLRRDDNNDDGGLKTSTKVGIAIGIICFVTIIASFWLIWRYRKKPQPPTEFDDFTQESIDRWMNNVVRGGGRASESTDRNSQRGNNYTRRASGSTLETYVGDGSPAKGNFELSLPHQAHTATHS